MKKTVELSLDLKGVDEATEKAEKLVNVLKEAKTLADELASIEFDVDVKE